MLFTGPYMIIIGKMTSKIQRKTNSTIEWQTQFTKFTTNEKVKINLCQPEFSGTKIVIWECHVDEYTTIRYDITLGKHLLVALGLDAIFPNMSS